MAAKLRDFTGTFSADVNRDPDYDQEGADKNNCDQPLGNMTDPQGAIERPHRVDRLARV